MGLQVDHLALRADHKVMRVETRSVGQNHSCGEGRLDLTDSWVLL